MSSKSFARIVIAIAVGLAIFLISNGLSFLIKGAPLVATTELSMLVLSIVAIVALGRARFSEYGFQMPRNIKWIRTLLTLAAAVVLGVLSSFVIVLSGASGLPMMKELSFLQIILFIWLLASVAEEVLVRGFVQSYMAPLNEARIKLLAVEIDVPTLIGALFFGALHIVVLTTGADVLTTVTVVIYTFLIGLLAGHSRARTQSLVPAVAIHVLTNVGGAIGGIIATILKVLVTGELPNV